MHTEQTGLKLPEIWRLLPLSNLSHHTQLAGPCWTQVPYRERPESSSSSFFPSLWCLEISPLGIIKRKCTAASAVHFERVGLAYFPSWGDNAHRLRRKEGRKPLSHRQDHRRWAVISSNEGQPLPADLNRSSTISSLHIMRKPWCHLTTPQVPLSELSTENMS